MINIIKSKKLTQSIWLKAILVGVIFYPLGVMAQAKNGHIISQKNRKYAPGTLEIKAGETIKILNDDIFLHHAFVESDNLKFDSGSMEEGESVEVTFDKPGQYDVKCAIHPKMNLAVTVK